MLDLRKTSWTDSMTQRTDLQHDMRITMLSDMAMMLCRQFSVYTAPRQAAMAEALQLPLADYKALELIMELEALPTGQLAHLLGISSGGTTALINRLEAGGYVIRDRHPLDRRVIVIRPVHTRCQAVEAILHQVSRDLADRTGRYDLEQLESVHEFLALCMRGFRKDTLQWLESRHDRKTHNV